MEKEILKNITQKKEKFFKDKNKTWEGVINFVL